MTTRSLVGAIKWFALCAFAVTLAVVPMARTARAGVDFRVKPNDGNAWGLAQFRSGGLIDGRCANRPCIALTFDDGPEWSSTPDILEELDRRKVRATFFVVGHRLDGLDEIHLRNREVLRDVWRRGHLVGNHTYSHDLLDTMDEATLTREIDRTSELIEEVIGVKTFLFRAPYGALHHPRALHAVFSRGLTPVFWMIDTRDWEVRTVEGTVANFRAGLQAHPNGGVVLFHDRLRSTADALPRIFAVVDEFNRARRAAGKPVYEFVGLDELWHPLGHNNNNRGTPGGNVYTGN